MSNTKYLEIVKAANHLGEQVTLLALKESLKYKRIKLLRSPAPDKIPVGSIEYNFEGKDIEASGFHQVIFPTGEIAILYRNEFEVLPDLETKH